MAHAARMTIEVEWNEYFAELCGSQMKLWKGYGLPVYEGEIAGLSENHSECLAYLMRNGYVREEGV